MKADGVIFDMDGLMFDTERLGLEGWKKAGRILGYPIGAEMVARIRGCNRTDAEKMFKERYGENFDYGRAREIRLNYAAREIEENGLPVKPGLYSLLEFLKNRELPMAVATACDSKTAHGNLEKAGIQEYFKAVICGDEIRHAKPWPDIFICAAKRLGTGCGNTIVFEDSVNGIEAAYRAGCIPVMVRILLCRMKRCKRNVFVLLTASVRQRRCLIHAAPQAGPYDNGLAFSYHRCSYDMKKPSGQDAHSREDVICRYAAALGA